MSFLKKLFGSGATVAAEAGPAAPTGETEHGGFVIRATPYKAEGGQYQTAGTIVAVIDGVEREHSFVRADRFASMEDATAFSLQKGRQIVDEQGRFLFASKPTAP